MLKIIGKHNEHIFLTILNRNSPISSDYWDANWLTAHIDLKVSSMKADYTTQIRTDELQSFYSGINDLLSRTEKEANFATMEDGLYLNLYLHTFGSITCSGKATLDPNNTIEFSFEMDNMQLDYLLKQLSQILETYPIIGIK